MISMMAGMKGVIISSSCWAQTGHNLDGDCSVVVGRAAMARKAKGASGYFVCIFWRSTASIHLGRFWDSEKDTYHFIRNQT